MDLRNNEVGKRKMMQDMGSFCIVFLFALFTPYMVLVFLNKIEQRKEEIILAGPEITIISEKGTEYIPLDEYLCGVLAPFVQKGYTTEELKVLSLILRSNLIYDMEKERVPIQEYFDRSYRGTLWEENFDVMENKMRSIIAETAGDILLYEGKIMEIPIFDFEGSGLSYDEILKEYYDVYTLYHYY